MAVVTLPTRCQVEHTFRTMRGEIENLRDFLHIYITYDNLLLLHRFTGLWFYLLLHVDGIFELISIWWNLNYSEQVSSCYCIRQQSQSLKINKMLNLYSAQKHIQNINIFYKFRLYGSLTFCGKLIEKYLLEDKLVRYFRKCNGKSSSDLNVSLILLPKINDLKLLQDELYI